MLSRLITAVSGTILIVSVIILAAAAPAGAQQPDLKIGAFFPDPQYPGEQLPTDDDLDDFDALIGTHTDVFLWYESISENFYVEAFEPMAQAGRTIQLAWEPHDFGRDPLNQPEYRLQRITAGDHDAEIRRWARELRDFGHEVLFRPMCEMNGNWVTWGGTVNGNSPEDYVPAWRHIHDIFVQEGATNVKWVWSPNRDGSIAAAQATFDTYYPGDAYVDYVGMNGYNWGRMYTTPEWTSQWQMLDEVFGYSYDVAVANTDKPVVICETASTEIGGDAQNGGKAEWIRDAFEQLPQRFPRVELITWFHINKETDWRVNSSPESLAAFRDAVAGDHSAPAISISSPLPGAVLSETVQVLTDSSDDTAVTKVELYMDDNLAGTSTVEPFDFELATRDFPAGPHTLRAVAYDATGNTGTAEIGVEVDRNFGIGATGVYWSSLMDYQSGALSVDYVVTSEIVPIQEFEIVGSVESNSVERLTPLPLQAGSIEPGSQGNSFTIKYNVPYRVDSFRSTLFATALAESGETYLIPYPYQGA